MRFLETISFLLILAVCAAPQAAAQGTPNFSPGRYICADDMPVTGSNICSAPEVADWNADGKKDLMVGVYYYGNIWLYLNQGTDEEPVFTEGTLLEADGSPIRVGFG